MLDFFRKLIIVYNVFEFELNIFKMSAKCLPFFHFLGNYSIYTNISFIEIRTPDIEFSLKCAQFVKGFHSYFVNIISLTSSEC